MGKQAKPCGHFDQTKKNVPKYGGTDTHAKCQATQAIEISRPIDQLASSMGILVV